MERVTRIELALSAWEADVLPLNYTREDRIWPLTASQGCQLPTMARPDIVPDRMSHETDSAQGGAPGAHGAGAASADSAKTPALLITRQRSRVPSMADMTDWIVTRYMS